MERNLQKAVKLYHQEPKNKDCLFMTENDTLEVVLLVIEKNFTYQPFKKN